MEADFIDSVNIKEVQLGKKVLHLNKKGKNKLELNFLQKLQNLWGSTEHLKKTYDKSYNLDRSLEDDLNNRDNLLTSIFSSECPDKQFNGLSFSTLHELKKKVILLKLTL